MSKKSAGLLLYREKNGFIEIFLAHPGGPFWKKKDDGAWTIPKGEFEEGEEPLAVARREFEEETGFNLTGDFALLEPIQQPGGKLVYAWSIKGDVNPANLKSNSFSMEWPPKSGKQQDSPEIDRAEWFSVELARRKILKGQSGFITQLEITLGI